MFNLKKLLAALAVACVCSGAAAEPMRLTVIDTQAASVECVKRLWQQGSYISAVLSSMVGPVAACATYSPGRCEVVIPLSGPATALSILALETPDSLVWHEIIGHCVGEKDFHEAVTWATDR